MTTPEDRLVMIEARLAELPLPDVSTAEEFTRREHLRFARVFGTAAPAFRTAVRLRFYGPGVSGHDLRGALAGEVIATFTESVKAAGARFKSASPDLLELYLSPTVAPGSTVLELYGSPRPTGDPALGDEIIDTPVDAALGELFGVLNGIDDSAPDGSAAEGGRIDGMLGKHLFALSSELLKGDVDLEIGWERPRGAVMRTNLTRDRSRRLRDVLDRDRIDTAHRTGRGELVSVSTEGRIGIRLAGTKRIVPILAADFDANVLRNLWAREVDAAWTETVVSHPQRDTRSVTNVLERIGPAAEPAFQPELHADL